MIHGVFCGGEVWCRMAASFREIGWRVETPTIRPEFRRTEQPHSSLRELTLADYASEMEAEARRLESETGRAPIVFGHSLGGLIAQKLAERGVVRAAVLLTPLAPAGVPTEPSVAALFTFANVILTPNFTARAVKIWSSGFRWGFLNCVPRVRHAEICAARRYDSGLVLRDVGQPDKDPHRVAHIDETRVTVPILTVGAAKDRVIPVVMHRRVAEKYASVGGDYLEYPEHGHWILDEPRTEQVIADIATWLDAKAAR